MFKFKIWTFLCKNSNLIEKCRCIRWIFLAFALKCDQFSNSLVCLCLDKWEHKGHFGGNHEFQFSRRLQKCAAATAAGHFGVGHCRVERRTQIHDGNLKLNLFSIWVWIVWIAGAASENCGHRGHPQAGVSLEGRSAAARVPKNCDCTWIK